MTASVLPLRQVNLARLPASIRRPQYDRQRLVPSVLHIGVGGFHRAHQAVYADDLAALSGDTAWGHCGVGLLEQDARMRDVLRAQDGLYTVLTRAPGGDQARIVGSIVDFAYAPADREAVLARLASPQCRIVSLTITEGGYYRQDATGAFADGHPDVVHDIAHPRSPRCSFGYLAAALDRRRRAGVAPFTVLSCDNVQHNGDTARATLLAFAELRDPVLRRWIETHVAFPNCMVDRIVPATTDEHRAIARERFGVDDAWPVVAEPFQQWVVEDRFCNGRPEWDRVGVQFTTDVAPYERMKMRLLNGSHQALAHAGRLVGFEFAHEAIAHPGIRSLVRRLMDDEVTPLLDAPAGIDLDDYKRTLLERLANPTILDPLSRIATDASARMPKFVLPSLATQLERNGPIAALCFTLAAWFHGLAGRADDGLPLETTDTMRTRLVQAASDPSLAALFGIENLIDARIAASARCRALVRRYVHSFRERGCRATLDEFTDAGSVMA